MTFLFLPTTSHLRGRITWTTGITFGLRSRIIKSVSEKVYHNISKYKRIKTRTKRQRQMTS